MALCQMKKDFFYIPINPDVREASVHAVLCVLTRIGNSTYGARGGHGLMSPSHLNDTVRHISSSLPASLLHSLWFLGRPPPLHHFIICRRSTNSMIFMKLLFCWSGSPPEDRGPGWFSALQMPRGSKVASPLQNCFESKLFQVSSIFWGGLIKIPSGHLKRIGLRPCWIIKQISQNRSQFYFSFFT